MTNRFEIQLHILHGFHSTNILGVVNPRKKLHHIKIIFSMVNPYKTKGVFFKKRSKSAISSSRRKNEISFTFLHFQL
jgi:hypothetical protein